MTYRELNSLWLNTTTIGKMMSEKGFNCGYIENLEDVKEVHKFT